MAATLTDVEKIRRLPWLVSGDVLNIIFVSLTFAGPVFILFLDQLGLGSAQIGFLLSLIPFCGVIALFIAPLVTRFGYKRVFITFWGVRKFVIALLLLTPVFLARFGAQAAFIWVAGIIFSFAICRAIAETARYPWQQEVIPDSIRGKFGAVSGMSTTMAAIIATIGASLVIGSGTGLGRFMILMAIGIGAGLLGVMAYSRAPAETQGGADGARTGHLKGMQQALHDRNFLFFLGALGLAAVGSALVISFIPLFMMGQVGLSAATVVLLGIGTYLGSLLTSYLWGWTSDRYGSKPVMQLSLGLTLLLPLAWFSMPRNSPMSAPLAMVIAFVAGAATFGWQISWRRYLYINATPRERKSPYLAVYYAWFGLVSGFGPLLAGLILVRTADIETELGVFAIDPYTPLFALSLILLAAGVVTVSWLHSDKPTTFRRLASMFWRGNPIRYRFAGTEVTRIAATQRLGDTQNPLSANELIEALSDPSFNVRYEAVNSIGRLPPEPELIDALLAVLGETEAELGAVAARSLGALGDKRAIAPLRQALCLGYPFLEVSSVRALAMLGDVDSVPYFLEKLKHETDGMLCIAYASALGKLRATQATESLFALLRQAEPEVARGEIGLALARIAGDERYYLQHWPSLRSDLNTATAQAVLALQKPARHLKADAFGTLAEACAECYARGDLSGGASYLKDMIHALPTHGLDETLVCILDECAAGLAEFRSTRLEFVLLSLHTLDIALRQ
jgi:HEAT repeat protein/predicted MFS family arabinose efflux permease